MLDKAGTPQVRLVPVSEAEADRRRSIGEKRRLAFGILKDAFGGYDTSLPALKADHTDPDERFRRRFGLPD